MKSSVNLKLSAYLKSVANLKLIVDLKFGAYLKSSAGLKMSVNLKLKFEMVPGRYRLVVGVVSRWGSGQISKGSRVYKHF